MIDLPLNVDVFCSDGRCGRITNVILNPMTHEATHLIVALNDRPRTEYLVPVRFLGASTPASINLRCTTEELKAQAPFMEKEFVNVQVPQYGSGAMAWPVATTKSKRQIVTHYKIPIGEMAVRRGAQVEATDGKVGTLEDFLVDKKCRVTHLILGKGNLWGHKDIAIPVSEVESYGEQTVHLKLDKKSVNELPTIEIHH